MIGGASQNIIALTDSLFLYHHDQLMFAAMGFVGVYYLIIAAIGYGFSRGGQIFIARRMGEKNRLAIGHLTHTMIVFELLIATLMFLLMKFGSEPLFRLLAQSDTIIQHSLEYIQYRSWGIFFSYLGVAYVALYAGVARTSIIGYQTLVLIVVNLILNYGFIFGHFGLPTMGIGGAGLASTLAEAIAVVVFTGFIFLDRKKNPYFLFQIHPINWKSIRQIVRVSVPFIVQSIVGLGSWFLLFTWIENMGEEELAVSNLGRIAYLIFSVPIWGYAAGIQTMVSGYIGKNKLKAVIPIIWKTARLSLMTTCLIAFPFLILPEFFLYPLLGAEDMHLVYEAKPVFLVILGLLAMFSVATIFFNGLSGTGASFQGLNIQIVCTLIYLLCAFYIIKVRDMGLVWAWASEGIYWLLILFASSAALQTEKWKGIFD
ncbi:MAG TPA: MATE family efflux transporter [Saprospiraceae bacterium]|nr:MATE family efflux transporter [Saprospiraceae bacterium]